MKPFIESINEEIKKEWIMRDPKRINKVLKGIKKLWKRMPDYRLTQLLYFITGLNDFFYTEDDQLEELIQGKLNAIRRIQPK